MKSDQEKLDYLVGIYKDNPVLFVKSVIGFDLTEQQTKLIEAAHKMDARVACKSATGTGKTTTLACLILHQLITQPSCKILATAPSSGQLKRGLRSELELLHGRMQPLFKNQYELQQDVVYLTGKKGTQFCSLVSADTSNQESLAGFHAKKVLVLMDEASAIEQEKYDTLVGNLTTKGSSLIQISNPVRSDGPFRNLWAKPENQKLWELITLDAFHSPLISKEWIDMIRAEYGEDSDFWRMRVLGEFPTTSEDTFFNTEDVYAAANRKLKITEYVNYPKVVGVDVARFGSDKTVFLLRQGPKVLDIQKFDGLDTTEVGQELAAYYHIHKPEMIYVDGTGVGSGVVDRCKALGLPYVDVVVGGKSSDPLTYANLRAQLYGSMKDWIRNDGDIPDDEDMVNEFCSMRYAFTKKGQIQLMSKKEIKGKLGLPSPDIIDALSMTFSDAVFERGRVKYIKKRIIKRSNYCW